MNSPRNILITTVYLPHKNYRYDYVEANTKNRFFKFYLPRIESAGLRFIKQNIPEIDILEYPTWEQYQQKLKEKQWDVVGFSFFMNETPEILEMVKYARTQDIPDIWAGNYGALTDSISHHFDQAFTGYSEQMIADKIGRKLQQHQILHPPIITPTRLYFGIHLNCMGILYTNRGCNNSCDFCQTPSFCQKPYKLSIESIETVLRYYKKVGISELIIIDENFGVFKKHAEQVVDLLDKYGFYWFVMTRADILKNRLDDWSEKRMAGAFIGIESFNEETLLQINKKEKADEILKVINRMKELNRFIIGYYMLGFETDTIASLKKDLRRLSELKLDITQLCVVTPFPRTPLWDHIEKTYGIFDKDYHHFNAKHLVWNHPHISPDEMSSLIEYGFKICYPSTRLFQTSIGFLKRYISYQGYLKGMSYTIKHFIHANSFPYTPDRLRLID